VALRGSLNRISDGENYNFFELLREGGATLPIYIA